MKIAITYPPLESSKGTPLLAQNRQFQWFNNPTFIYPMVPASAATLLYENGFDVVWNDAIAEKWTYSEYLEYYKKQNFDLVMIETKTPVIKLHWKIIEELKSICPHTIIVLVGDHVTALPEESMKACPVDFIITGGNYDFELEGLCENIRDGFNAYKLNPGIWYRDRNKSICNTGKFVLNHNLNELPIINRDLTKWQLYATENGNYSRTPGTYTMVARDCWHHQCSFCSWTTLYNKYLTRSPESLLDEIGILIDKYGVKEIMDDSGAFPIGKWLKTFCEGMIDRGYNKRVCIDCNMRLDALSLEEYKLMKKAGFRLILFGIESANQYTLDRINKKENIERMIESCKNARKAGLFPHITMMFGYPWEDEGMVKNSVKLAKKLLIKGYASSLQATILIPYPGTLLFNECKCNDLLLTDNYDDYDQRKIVIKTFLKNNDIKKAIQSVYRIAFNPIFLAQKIIRIRSKDDIRTYYKSAKKVIGHLLDFSNNNKKR